MWDNFDRYDDGEDRSMFADPGGNSALRAETPDNPRNLPCPTCKWPNRLTPADRRLGYQCDSCADAQEQGGEINYYDGWNAAEHVNAMHDDEPEADEDEDDV